MHITINSVCFAVFFSLPIWASQRNLRLFGQDINIDESAAFSSNTLSEPLLLNAPIEASTSRQDVLNNPPIYLYPNTQTGQSFEGMMQRFNLPNMSPAARQAIMGEYLVHYRFPMIRPLAEDIDAMMAGTLPRGADFMGHPDNDLILRRYIDHMYPPDRGTDFIRENHAAKKELEALQAAMRYLNSHPTAGIIDERYGRILMSPIWRQSRFKSLLTELFSKYERGMLPKLRSRDGKVHFKTSDAKKRDHRRQGGRSEGKWMEEETSSEDEY